MRRRMMAGRMLAVLMLASACAAARAGDALPSGQAPGVLELAALDLPSTGARYGEHLVALINRFRERNGLPALDWAAELVSIASEHSHEMASRRRISHDGFVRRFEKADSALCVENVGQGFPHAEALLDGWRASPAHLRNLLEPGVRRIGVANASAFVTLFACR